MDILSLAIKLSELALWAVLFWFVLAFVAVPDIPRRACQILIVFIALMASLQLILGSPGVARNSMSHSLAVPDIMVPERR